MSNKQTDGGSATPEAESVNHPCGCSKDGRYVVGGCKEHMSVPFSPCCFCDTPVTCEAKGCEQRERSRANCTFPSATPEGKPTAREVVHAAIGDCAKTGNGLCRWACDAMTAAIEQDRAARDALHAETLRREVQAQATSDAGSFAAERAELQRLVADARAALQHGEERERVMREALEELERIGDPGAGVKTRARRALATAQAMKEGTNG